MSDASEGARDGLTSVTKGALIMLLGTLGLVAETFFSRVILARGLPAPDVSPEYSTFVLGLTLAGLLATLGALGLPSAIARNLPYARRDDDRRAIVGVAFRVGIPAAIAVAAALFLWGVLLNSSDPLLAVTLEFFALALFFQMIGGLIASVFQGYEDVYPNALFVQILTPSLFLGFLIAAQLIPSSFAFYSIAVAGYVLANLVTLLALVAYTRRRLPKRLPPGPEAPGVSRKLLLFAAPLFVVGILTYLTQNGDTLLLGVFNRAEVGLYNAPLLLARLLQVGLGALSFIFLPVTARFVREGKTQAVRVIYTTTTKWMALTSLPLFLVFFFAPARSLGFVYTSNYVGGAVALQVVVVGAFLSTIAGPAVAALVSYGRTRLLLYNAIASAASDLLLSVVLIPTYGLVGAAVAWAVANALFTSISAIELAYFERVHCFRRHYLLPLALTAIPLSIVFVLTNPSLPLWTLPVIVIAIALVYFLAVIFSGSVDDGDKMLLEVIEQFLGRRLPLVRRMGRWGASFSRRG